MYQTESDLREERTRRLMYILFSVSMLISALICATILFFILAPAQGKRLVGGETEFIAGEVAEVPVKRLELSKLLPNAPQWSEDIIFVVKQNDASYRAFLALDPKTGCKLNWRDRDQHFIDNCSQTTYNASGRNQNGVTTLSSQPQHMIELPVEVESGEVYVLDQMKVRDRR
jgi:hypothetical protein